MLTALISILIIEPRILDKFCPLFKGSPDPPPSPKEIYKFPSGPNDNCPPL